MNKLINRAKSVKNLSSLYFTVTVAVYITKILMLKKCYKNFKRAFSKLQALHLNRFLVIEWDSTLLKNCRT